MEPSGAVCEMGGNPDLACYVPLGGMAIMFLLAAGCMAIPIALEFRNEARWLLRLAGRVAAFRPAARRIPTADDGGLNLGGDVLRGRWPVTDGAEDESADLEKAA